MAGGMDLGTSGKGGKKSLDAALNLVPFIDLMAVTIVFLITEKDLKLTVGGSQLDPLPVTRDDQGRLEVDKLLVKLRVLKTEQPEQSAITLSTEDSVRYEDLVRLIDAVVQDGTAPLFPSVSVSPAS
jgi:biopolymer transport protein TolR